MGESICWRSCRVGWMVRRSGRGGAWGLFHGDVRGCCRLAFPSLSAALQTSIADLPPARPLNGLRHRAADGRMDALCSRPIEAYRRVAMGCSSTMWHCMSLYTYPCLAFGLWETTVEGVR